jgi:hypothetical protein
MSTPTSDEWTSISRRNARSVQTTVGWIFWDPRAVRRYQARGLAPGLGYIAARCAPFAGDGPDAFLDVWRDRNEAIREGLETYAPDIVAALEEFGPLLWDVAAKLPLAGRPFAASHLSLVLPEDPVLVGWHAVNFFREWRGDTHWALVATHGLSGGEASVLHNAWLGYEGDWLSLSRGSSLEEIDEAWRGLTSKGWAHDRRVNDAGTALRQRLEDETDRLSAFAWQLLGRDKSVDFAERFERPCVALLARVDETAGVNYQPASRVRGSDSNAARVKE